MIDSKDKVEKSKEWGAAAEQFATDYLLKEGYVIRERNWRPKRTHLEIDIIAQLPGTIVFVEVKARSQDTTDPSDAVDLKKQRNMARAAAIYLSSVNEDFDYRFDIITVLPRGVYDESVTPATDFARKYAPKVIAPTLLTDEYALDHLPDAFLPPLRIR